MSKGFKKKFTTTAACYEFLTGVSASCGRLYANPAHQGPPGTHGPNPSTVDEKFESFFEWISDKIESAKQGGYITLRGIKRDLKIERDLTVSVRVLRRTMRRMGFRYVRRVGRWHSRRHEERIQKRLWAFVEWAVENSTRTEVIQQDDAANKGKKGRKKKAESDGKVYSISWNIPVACQDESFVHDALFRFNSWCPLDDKTYDRKKKGDGTRVNMLHTIFSHIPQPMDPKRPYHPTALVTWKSTWTGKTHEFRGATVVAAHIHRYFSTRVFGGMSGGATLIDNAQTHTELTEEYKEMEEADLETLIHKKTSNQKKGSYRWEAHQAFNEKKKSSLFPPDAKVLRKFIREWHLLDTVLYEMADAYNVRLIYLPQYYPECNPIERYWALLKRYYYDSDPDLPHATRLRQALERIPPDYVEKCFQKSLEWIYKTHAEMKKTRGACAGAKQVVGDEDLMSVGSEDDDEDDEDEDED
jgi:hypothetical protein